MAETIQSPPPGVSLEQLTKTVQQLCNFCNKLIDAIPANSTAVDVPGVVADLNALQTALGAVDGK